MFSPRAKNSAVPARSLAVVGFAAAAAVSLVATTAADAGTTVASYNLSAVPAPLVPVTATTAASTTSTASAKTELHTSATSKVALAAGIDPAGVDGALDFPGWRETFQSYLGTTKIAALPNSGRDGILSAGTNNYFATTASAGNDLGDNTFDPGDGGLSVSVWAKPDSPYTFPFDQANVGMTNGNANGKFGLGAVSPNLLQKGLPGATNYGAYKISMVAYNYGTATAPDLHWQPFCGFRGNIVRTTGKADAGTVLRQTAMGSTQARAFKMPNDTAFQFTCELARNGAIKLTVKDVAGAVVYTNTKGPVLGEHHLRVNSPKQFFVGSKPSTIDATDAYAGTLDSIVVTKF